MLAQTYMKHTPCTEKIFDNFNLPGMCLYIFVYTACEHDLMKTEKQVGTEMHLLMLVKFFHMSFYAHFLLGKEKPLCLKTLWPFSHLSTEIKQIVNFNLISGLVTQCSIRHLDGKGKVFDSACVKS